ncbi:AraC family transcriptional regulator [Paenibacillus solisilvae]|uniref:AraC family transcriptional regulator n=1 Tax=Paenibacillus solisilvae TaxID=2486751 RepID=A0ABW0W4N5_9BACL
MEWRDLDYTPEFNKLYYICEGEGWLKIGDEEFYPKPGQLCLLPAYTQQSYSYINERPFLKYWCHFTATIGPFDLFQWIGVPFCIDIQDKEEMTRLFKQLAALYDNNSVISRIREKAIILEIISLYLEQVPLRILQHRSEDMKRITFIQEYIESHLSTGLKIEDMAKASHLHPNYFIAYFKKHFGVSPLKYVSRKRADKAKILLTTTALSVKEIADQTGFVETNHFAKFFRKETGHSPSEFRSIFS